MHRLRPGWSKRSSPGDYKRSPMGSNDSRPPTPGELEACKPRIRPFRKSSDDDPIRELGAQFSLGPKSSRWLYDAGVRTRADIEHLGSIEVCRRMLAAGHPV